MTMCLKNSSRRWFSNAALATILGAGLATGATTVEAAGRLISTNAPFVYPRAGVSSDAYRTPPQLLSPQAAQPLLAHRAVPREPAILAQATTARAGAMANRIIPAEHRAVQQVSGRQNRQSVMNELQRLYEEEGREMPQMEVPAYQQQAPATAQPSPQYTNNVAPPVTQVEPQRKSGLIAGLFDFARRSRDDRTGRGSMQMQPPEEPQPFRPPTYRQQPQRITPSPAQQPQRLAQQPQRAAQTPAQQPQTGAGRQQATAQTQQSKAAVSLKRTTPDRIFATTDDVFFPGEESGALDIVPEGNSAQQPPQTLDVDSLSEFFPGDGGEDAAEPHDDTLVVKRGATSAAEVAQKNLAPEPTDQSGSEPQSANVGEAFSMPTPVTEEEIIPRPAPAAISEIVTTNVAPLPPSAGPAEPAPFFADEERAIDPSEEMDVAALSGQTFDPSGADSAATAGSVSDSPDAGSLMQQIAAREGVGLKGFCPVALRDERRLADGRAGFVSFYRGKAYYFSTAEAKATFDDVPAQYSPASGGEDITLKTLTGEVVEGSLDHSVWYKGKLYLFQSADNLKTFMAAPSAMAEID